MHDSSDVVVKITPLVPSQSSAKLCSNCGLDLCKAKEEWCPRCGYHPRFGTCIELDPWDRVADPAVDQTPEPIKWWRRVPVHGWALLGGSVGIITLTIVGRIATAPNSKARAWWSVIEFLVGLLAFFFGHLASYIHALIECDGFNIADFILKPWSIWSVTWRELPTSFRRVASGLWGLAAALSAAALLGGIPFYVLWTWEVAERPRTTLVEALNQKLDDDVRKMAGAAQKITEEADASSEENWMLRQQAEKLAKMQPVDCLIVGYVPVGNDDIDSLVLATEIYGKLKYVGVVRDLPEDVRHQLAIRLKKIVAERSFVPCPTSATWVEPKLTCRVRANDGWKTKGLQTPVFEKVLAEIAPR